MGPSRANRVFEILFYGMAFLVLKLFLFSARAARLVPPELTSGMPAMDCEYKRVTRDMVLYLSSDCRP